MDMHNNTYLIENEKNNFYGIYIMISIIIIISLMIFIINFEYTKKRTLYIDKKEILVMVNDKQATFKLGENSYKPKILKKKFYYEAKIKLKEIKPTILEIYEQTTIYKSTLFNLRKELLNAENIQ